MSDQFKVRVADPMADSCFRTSEKIVENSDLVPKEHEPINKMGSDETGATSDKYALALGWRKQLNWREARKCGVRYRLSIGEVN